MEGATAGLCDGDFFAVLFIIVVEDPDVEVEVVAEEIVGGNIPADDEPLSKGGTAKGWIGSADIVASKVLVGEVLCVGGDVAIAAAREEKGEEEAKQKLGVHGR